MINTFNKENIKEVRHAVEFALAKVAEEMGIELSLGNISYGEYKFTGKIEASVLMSKEEKAELEREEFASLASEYGFSASDYGKTFISNGSTFTIYKIKTRNRKYPILARKSDGKTYKFSPVVVKLCMKT